MSDINQALLSMIGKTIVRSSDVAKGAETILFRMSDGSTYVFHHNQESCEGVEVEDITGDVADLIGSQLTMAEESADTASVFDGGESQTWTFYKFSTIKGSVTIRWLGQSNGPYSEAVDLTVFHLGDKFPPKFLNAARLLLMPEL